MKKVIGLILLFVTFQFAHANQKVVTFHSQIVTALSPHDSVSKVNVVHHNDLVVNLVSAKEKIVAIVVSEPQYCSYNELVAFVGHNQVKVVVQKNAFKTFNVSAFNQTVISCVKVTKVNNVVVQKQVVKEVKVVGVLSGSNARQVKFAVAACK